MLKWHSFPLSTYIHVNWYPGPHAWYYPIVLNILYAHDLFGGGHMIILGGFIWIIYPYSSGLFYFRRGNRLIHMIAIITIKVNLLIFPVTSLAPGHSYNVIHRDNLIVISLGIVSDENWRYSDELSYALQMLFHLPPTCHSLLANSFKQQLVCEFTTTFLRWCGRFWIVFILVAPFVLFFYLFVLF